VGVFDGQDEAERALEQLREAGLQPGDVSLLMRDAPSGDTESERSYPSPVAGGAAAGAALGGLLGGAAGWAIAIGAITIPGVGFLIGAGALAATLTGIALGAATGGLIGGLLGLGVPEDEARQYEGHVREGRVLLTVHPGPDLPVERVTGIVEANGGYDVRVYDLPAPHVSAPVEVGDTVMEEGEVAADTDSFGSGAEGGAGDGAALGTDADAERQALNASIAAETAQAFDQTEASTAPDATSSGPVPTQAEDAVVAGTISESQGEPVDQTTSSADGEQQLASAQAEQESSDGEPIEGQGSTPS
jgi:hypothetical protein